MLVAVVTDIGLASVLMDLFITVVEVGAVVARTRKTGTSKEIRSSYEDYAFKRIYLDSRMSCDKSLVHESMVVFEFVEVVVEN
jgi:hypothetical protein